ncbi:hypothetical protein TNCV_2372301 [Trichonephila clavipes]|nr:hypothetical protein TNCV_2372301 [Trichonephila clavipes]
MKEVAEESMKRAAVEKNSSSPDNLLTVSGDGTWKTRGHLPLIGVCTVIGVETGDSDTKTFNAVSANKPYGDDHLIQKIECVGHEKKGMGTRLRKLKLVYDYFLWGYVKSLVYADKPQTVDHLEDNIRRVIADIRPQMLEKVIENWTSRLGYIRASRGSPLPGIIFKM